MLLITSVLPFTNVKYYMSPILAHIFAQARSTAGENHISSQPFFVVHSKIVTILFAYS